MIATIWEELGQDRLAACWPTYKSRRSRMDSRSQSIGLGRAPYPHMASMDRRRRSCRICGLAGMDAPFPLTQLNRHCRTPNQSGVGGKRAISLRSKSHVVVFAFVAVRTSIEEKFLPVWRSGSRLHAARWPFLAAIFLIPYARFSPTNEARRLAT